ncbi:hypothetical protein PoB_001647300 [Plakobranchus ocellatus]|uniref:Uncharacterized protein n=1 Tax=Plakobranchus ocellatus TaxID=259542 RepID=A0AAV3Z5L8_9GAST|nr:hypothetical protein PoB_001647300 [Plakobranchus ocellatus]
MDVRKLATIFVLDIIKPLKLDDPNDGEFLSERMQRLPYLIMVVENLILNVNIFKYARSKKADAFAGEPDQSQRQCGTAKEVVGCRDLEFSENLNDSKPARRTVSSASCTSHTQQSTNVTRSVMCDLVKRPSPPPFYSKAGRFVSTQNDSCSAENLRLTTNFNERYEVQTHQRSSVPIHDLPSTGLNCSDYLTTDEKSLNSFFKINPTISQSAQYSSCASISSSTSTLHNNTRCGVPSACVSEQYLSNVNVITQRKSFEPSVFDSKAIFKNMSSIQNVKLYRWAGRGSKLCRNIRSKAKSLPALTKTQPMITSKKSRDASYTIHVEMKGSSPKKKRSPIKRKLSSLRVGESRTVRPVERRRWSSTGTLGSGPSGGRQAPWSRNPINKRKTRCNSSIKKSLESSGTAATSVTCFSRGSDKITFTPNEIICPWFDDGTASDDSSLMTRTIRNPRILAVPISPVASQPAKKHNRRYRRLRRSRGSSFLTSVDIQKSPPRLAPSLPPHLTLVYSGHQQDSYSRFTDLNLPLGSAMSSFCDNSPCASGSNNRTGSALAGKLSPSELTHRLPIGDESVSSRTLSDIKDTHVEKRESWSNFKQPCDQLSEKGNRIASRESCSESYHSHVESDKISGEKDTISQASGEDFASVSCYDWHCGDSVVARKASSGSLYNPTSFNLPSHSSFKITHEKLPEEVEEAQSSQELISMNSCQLSPNMYSEVSLTMSHLQPDNFTQRYQQPHYRRINLHLLRQLRLHAHLIKQRQQTAKRSMDYRRKYLSRLWLLIFLLITCFAVLHLAQEVKAVR